MKKTRIRFFKFSDGKQNLQFHWPKQTFGDSRPLNFDK